MKEPVAFGRMRYNIRAMLADAALRREIIVGSIMTIQSREGIMITREQAEAAYDRVYGETHDHEVSED